MHKRVLDGRDFAAQRIQVKREIKIHCTGSFVLSIDYEYELNYRVPRMRQNDRPKILFFKIWQFKIPNWNATI